MSTEDLLGESHSEELASVLQDAGSQDDESVPVGVTQSKKDVNPLTAEVISKGISLLAKTGNGLSYAYTKLELHALELTGIQILENYPHLRYVVSEFVSTLLTSNCRTLVKTDSFKQMAWRTSHTSFPWTYRTMISRVFRRACLTWRICRLQTLAKTKSNHSRLHLGQ